MAYKKVIDCLKSKDGEFYRDEFKEYPYTMLYNFDETKIREIAKLPGLVEVNNISDSFYNYGQILFSNQAHNVNNYFLYSTPLAILIGFSVNPLIGTPVILYWTFYFFPKLKFQELEANCRELVETSITDSKMICLKSYPVAAKTINLFCALLSLKDVLNEFIQDSEKAQVAKFMDEPTSSQNETISIKILGATESYSSHNDTDVMAQ
jgi:hypothetical protein